jgi:hypothetical protein
VATPAISITTASTKTDSTTSIPSVSSYLLGFFRAEAPPVSFAALEKNRNSLTAARKSGIL